jgi:hypothetical protein
MLFYFSTLLISVNITNLRFGDRSPIKVFAVDSVLCYAKYTAALAALEAAVKDLRHSDFPSLKATLADDLGDFKTSCANKYGVATCKKVVDDQLADLTEDGPKDFTTNCKIEEPKTDADDCYSAYAALVAALEKLKPTSARRIQMKAAATELDAFVTKCPKTSHSAECLPVLSPIDPTTGPIYDDLEDIQGKYTVKAPPAGGSGGGGSGNHGVLAFHASSGFLMIISLIIHLYLIL